MRITKNKFINKHGFTLRSKARASKQGFTLIELLVTMGVIAILVSLSIFALQAARESARDAKRKADVEAIRTALELYRADCGRYPNASGNQVPNPLSGTGSCSGNTYMEEVPTDPVSGNIYRYTRSSNTSYTLCAFLEGGGTDAGCGSCGSAGVCNYKTTNP